MKCLVTGGAGFIGSHLCELLLKENHEVVALDNLAVGRIENLVSFENNSNFKFHNADITDLKEIEPYFEEIDWVFHLAGLADIVPSIENPQAYFDSNVAGSLNVALASTRNSVKRFVYAASSSCYGIPDQFPTPETSKNDPRYPYALTKLLGEQIILHWSDVYRLPAISLRLFNVYGPRARTSGTYGAVFGVFLAQKNAGLPYTVVGDGNQTRDFTYVTDVVKAFLSAAESTHSGEIYNVGSGDSYSVNRLVQLLGGPVTYIPKRPGEPDKTFADISKIRRDLRWSPQISLEDGVRDMLLRLEDWKSAPIWRPESIADATKTWFDYLTPTEIDKE
jgi:UDP-glucose 4-epimerase